MTRFLSDNVTSACPEVMKAIFEANSGDANSYGDDDWSQRLGGRVSEVFEKEVLVFPVASGTASNALALACLTPTYGKVFCHQLSHINTDECNAPEFFSGGAKLVPIEGALGKIRPDDLAQAIRGAGNVHAAQPACVSIAQSCEAGTLYQVGEIAALAEVAKAQGLSFHMDGARFANGLVGLGVSPAEMTWRAGVDVLSLGGTKNGCLAAEAIVFFRPELAEAMPFLRKRAGHLLSKMRFISAQLEAYLSDDVWLRNARQANDMAARLSQGLAAIEGVSLAYPIQANEIFVELPDWAVSRLEKAGYEVNDQELDEQAPPRFVTAWNTQEDQIDSFIAALSADGA